MKKKRRGIYLNYIESFTEKMKTEGFLFSFERMQTKFPYVATLKLKNGEIIGLKAKKQGSVLYLHPLETNASNEDRLNISYLIDFFNEYKSHLKTEDLFLYSSFQNDFFGPMFKDFFDENSYLETDKTLSNFLYLFGFLNSASLGWIVKNDSSKNKHLIDSSIKYKNFLRDLKYTEPTFSYEFSHWYSNYIQYHLLGMTSTIEITKVGKILKFRETNLNITFDSLEECLDKVLKNRKVKSLFTYSTEYFEKRLYAINLSNKMSKKINNLLSNNQPVHILEKHCGDTENNKKNFFFFYEQIKFFNIGYDVFITNKERIIFQDKVDDVFNAFEIFKEKVKKGLEIPPGNLEIKLERQKRKLESKFPLKNHSAI